MYRKAKTLDANRDQHVCHRLATCLRKAFASVRAGELSPEKVLSGIFLLLFLQLNIILFASLLSGTDPTFVHRFFPGFDFHDFYFASDRWLRGLNPYADARFVTPPPSLWIGAALHPLTFSQAHAVFFILNLFFVLGGVLALARYYQFSIFLQMDRCWHQCPVLSVPISGRTRQH